MSGASLGRVFLLGGTGMLAPAARVIARRAEALTLAARAPHALAAELGATPLPLDWNIPQVAIDALPAPGFDLVITWLHDNATYLARPCEDLAHAGGRSIRVHGAKSADPAIRAQRDPNPRPGLARQTVILGWFGPAKRWLTDEEISQGVIAALEAPAVRTLIVGDMGND